MKREESREETEDSSPRRVTGEEPAVDARYTLIRELARGGLGRVFLATDEALGRSVAIKQPLARTPESLARFEREAKLTARLQHAGVVPVYDVGRWAEGEPFFVMKKVEGRSLADVITATPTFEARLALLTKVLAVADVMAYAHSQGVVHRDLKPANVIVNDYGETVVIDWGLAKPITADEESDDRPVEAKRGSVTKEGRVLGTPQFMPPEQAAGAPLDQRADVYALGAILYNVLRGEGPYPGEDATDILARVKSGPPPSLRQQLPALQDDLAAIVEKAMARERLDRYASAGELAQDLRRFLDGQLVAAQNYSGLMLLGRWLRRHRSAAVLLVALVASAAIGVVSVVRQRNHAVAARQEVEARQNALVLLHAERSLAKEPTASAAWLKSYRPTGQESWRAHAIAEEAAATGVARHVFGFDLPALAVAVSAAEPRMLAGWGDGRLALYDLVSGGRTVLPPHHAAITAVAFSRAGGRMASGDRAGLVYLWTSAGQPLRQMRLPGAINRLEFSADGKRLAVATGNRTVSVLDASDQPPGAVRHGPPAHASFDLRARLSGMGFCANGRLLVTDLDGRLAVLENGATTPRTLAATHPDARLLCLPDGRRVVTAGVDGFVYLWDVEAGAGKRLLLGRHDDWVTSIAAAPDGSAIATGSGDDTIRLFSLSPAGRPAGAPRILRGHADTVRGLVFSKDGQRLVSAANDSTVRVWDLHSGEAVREFHAGVAGTTALFATADGRQVVASGPRGARVWSTDVPPVRIFRGHEGQITSLAWSPDGRALASSSRDQTLRVWSYPDGPRFVSPPLEAWTMVARFMGSAQDVLVNTRLGRPRLFDLRTGNDTPVAQRSGMYSVLVTNGEQLAYPTAEGVVILRLGGTDRVLLAESPPAVTDLAFMEGGARIAVATGDGVLGLWDARTGRKEGLCELGERIQDIAMAPSDRWAAVMTSNNRLVLWQPGTCRLIDVPTDRVAGGRLAFNADSSAVIYAAADETVRLVEVVGLRVHVLRGHRGRIFDLVQAPGGLLASSDALGFVRLWSTDTFATTVLQAGRAAVEKLAFSPDGRHLAAGGQDAVIRVWDVSGLALSPPSSDSPGALTRQTTALIDDRGRLGTP